MFVKLIILILALGSTGVTVLSVRQSRLVASNEMTQSRMRIRALERTTMDLRAQIASKITPSQIQSLLESTLGDEYENALVEMTDRKINILDPIDYERGASDSAPDGTPSTASGRDADQSLSFNAQTVDSETGIEDAVDIQAPDYWTLDDGTRVYLLNPIQD
ncbi:MAG: hypothetical protein AB8C13_05115 [Phycisphaerales bacterium]